MGAYINRGNEVFANYSNGEYIDKTGMIAFINSTLNTGNRLTCVTRPRRFGKSMAASMLCAYYDRSCDSSTLFDGFEIARDPSYREHLNKYHVINLDITTFISEYQGDDDIVKHIQEDIREDLIEEFPEVCIAERTRLMPALMKVAKHTGIKFIFVIDEWDALCRELYDKPQIMDEYVMFLRRMFKSNDTAMAFLGAIDHYIEIQELSSGKGYADLVFIPRRNSNKPVLVVELKWNKSVRTAIDQIEERDYPELLKDFSDEVLLVDISYDKDSKKHVCVIKKHTVG